MNMSISPHVSETERAVLAAILRNSQLLEVAQAAGIDADCFYDRQYRRVWEVFEKLEANGEPLEFTAIAAEMPDNVMLIGELVGAVATTYSFDRWCSRLKEYKVRRMLVQSVYDAQKALDSNSTADAVLSTLEESAVNARTILDTGARRSMQDVAKQAIEQANSPLPCLPVFPANTELSDRFKVHAGEFMVLAAKTGSGKTAMAAQMTTELIKGGKVVLYACTESTDYAILMRIAASICRIPHYAIANQSASPDEQKFFCNTLRHLGDCPRLRIIGCDGNLMTAARICRELKSFRLQQGHVDAVVVDFIQNIAPAKEDVRKPHLEQINNAIQQLHDAFILSKCSGIVLSQFNRGALNADAPPELKDLKDTSNLEQLADLVVFLHRPANPAPGDEDKTFFYSRKQRNMAAAKIKLSWNGTGYESEPLYSSRDYPQYRRT